MHWESIFLTKSGWLLRRHTAPAFHIVQQHLIDSVLSFKLTSPLISSFFQIPLKLSKFCGKCNNLAMLRTRVVCHQRSVGFGTYQGSSNLLGEENIDPDSQGCLVKLYTGELSGMYHALDWINTRRPSSSPVVRPRYITAFDSDYWVKLFATRSIKPVANKRTIARIYALLPRVKQSNDVSISWTPSHTKADSPHGNKAADLLAARGCVALGSPALRAPAFPLPHRVRAPSNLAPLVGPRPLPCFVAPEASGGSPSRPPSTPVWEETTPSLACFPPALSHAFSSCQCLSPAHGWILWGSSWRLEFFSECSRSVPSTR